MDDVKKNKSTQYKDKIELVAHAFMLAIEESNEINNTKQGFIGLIIRDLSTGNIDLVHNLVKNKDLVYVLEETLQTLKRKK